jgi:hypothetical protein
MRVLVACEYSGIVRDAFIAKGHEAMSCDILPTDRPNWTYDPLTDIRTHHPERGQHYKGDVLDIIYDGWDLMIAHPPCTYLTNSGVRWLHTQPGRWDQLRLAGEFFNRLLDAPIPRICIENPIPHKYAIECMNGRKYTQIIQPWQFGHGETKATCLWLKGLPKLQPTDIVDGREQRIWKLPPSEDRWKIRSTTYQGIADAMADQWGGE